MFAILIVILLAASAQETIATAPMPAHVGQVGLMQSVPRVPSHGLE